MASRVCTHCGIHFPTDDTFRVCIACGEGTHYTAHAYQEVNWRKRAELIAARQDELVKKELYAPPHVDTHTTVDDEGLEWLSSHDAIRAGNHLALDLVVGGVITIGPPRDTVVDGVDLCPDGPDCNLYEVISYVEDKRAYWVRPLVVPDFVPND